MQKAGIDIADKVPKYSIVIAAHNGGDYPLHV